MVDFLLLAQLYLMEVTECWWIKHFLSLQVFISMPIRKGLSGLKPRESFSTTKVLKSSMQPLWQRSRFTAFAVKQFPIHDALSHGRTIRAGYSDITGATRVFDLEQVIG